MNHTAMKNLWADMRSSKSPDQRLVVVIGEGSWKARRYFVPKDEAAVVAREIVSAYRRQGKAVRAYVYDENAEQIGSY